MRELEEILCDYKYKDSIYKIKKKIFELNVKRGDFVKIIFMEKKSKRLTHLDAIFLESADVLNQFFIGAVYKNINKIIQLGESQSLFRLVDIDFSKKFIINEKKINYNEKQFRRISV